MEYGKTEAKKRILNLCLAAVGAMLPLAGCSLGRLPQNRASAAPNALLPPAAIARQDSPGQQAFAPIYPASATTIPAAVLRTEPTVVHIGEENFDEQVLRSEVPVLVDFYANWCGPCKALAPTLEELAAETPQARVVKVNIDDSPQLAARYGVSSIPSLMVFKDGRVVAKQNGLVGKARLKSMLAL